MLRLALLQLVCTVGFSLGMYVCFTFYQGLSALLGGLVAVIANFYVALKTRKPLQVAPQVVDIDDLATATEMLQRFYRFEVTKIVLTLTMFAIGVFVIQVSVLPFIIAYLLAALIVTWLSLLVVDQHEV
jgi:F0F1-type ATP synthase assembly protein I